MSGQPLFELYQGDPVFVSVVGGLANGCSFSLFQYSRLMPKENKAPLPAVHDTMVLN
jgi:hypothetical protein